MPAATAAMTHMAITEALDGKNVDWRRKLPMRNTTVNVGPLLVTLAVVFTTYFGAALAMPAMPAGIQAALVSIPTCLLSMKGIPNEDHRAGVTLARVPGNG